MSDFSYERLEQSIKNLKLDISIEELATLVNERSMSIESLSDIDYLLSYLSEKKTQTAIAGYRQRIPRPSVHLIFRS